MDASTIAQTTVNDAFDRDTTGGDAATATEVVDLADGDTFDLVATPVRKRIGDAEVRLLAYNGSVPGPTLRVRQGATVTVNFTNRTELEGTVHWHGLRLANRYDGTHETQAPVPVGGSFADREEFEIDAVIWVTGYRDETDWVAIPEVKDARGAFVERRGISPVPGLTFIGRSWQWSRGSALLIGVGADAANIAQGLVQSLAVVPGVDRLPSSSALGTSVPALGGQD
jgi:hypothetical protein